MKERFMHFTYAINEITKYWRKLAGEEMERHGLRASHAVYFTVLAQYGETGLTAAQLCEYSGRDKADVSRMMTVLEEKGLVTKEGVHQNLYNGVFKLTEQGFEIARYVEQRAEKAVEAAGKDLTEESRAVFYSAIDSIVENLRLLSKNGIPKE